MLSKLRSFRFQGLLFIFISGCTREFEAEQDHFQYTNIYDFYTRQSEITDPGKYAGLFDELPGDPVELAVIVQGLCVYEAYFSSRGLKIPRKQKGYENHNVEVLLRKILRLNQEPLSESRDIQEKIAVICSNYATLYCSMLRHKNIPARVRSGYSTYFFPGKFDNHYVCEYWDADEKRWIQADAQLDSLHMAYFKIDFDPFDLPRDKFICGGEAWFMVKEEGYDPSLFGLGGDNWEGGMQFVRPGVYSDFINLNKFEVHPWDMHPDWDQAGKLEVSFIDRIARTTLDDARFKERIKLYEEFGELRLPAGWKPK
jgi:hypothetical protein